MYIYNMPLSFTMALAQQPKSAESFRNMTDDQKSEVVNKASTIRNKKDMWKFVMEINSMKN